jgi:hypothetical protein
MLEFEHGGCCISIVSHGPSPSQCRSPILAPNMAVSGRPLGAIWAVYLFAPNKKPRPGRMVGAPEAFIEINCACGGAKHGGPSEMASSQPAVRDSGPGIDPDHLDRVFDAFYTTKSGGVGMGLSICRSIIDVHGGRLWAAANEPHSSVFQFTLPRLENELMNSDCR